MDTRFEEIENIIRPMPNLTFREYPYNITDKKSDVKYAVTRIDGGIELRDQLALVQIDDLIESLLQKLKAHLDFMTIFLRAPKPIPWYAIKFVEYAPTDLHIGMQFGNMVDCDFYISKVIGHSIMDKDAKFLHFSLFKVRLLDHYSPIALLKSPPLNLHVLTSLTEFGPFCSTFYHTFLPMQILQQAQVDYSALHPFLNSPFIPNTEFGIFQFKHPSTHQVLVVQVVTSFVNNKLVIQMREAVSFATLMGLMGQLKIDFNKYYEDFRLLVRSWEFEHVYEVYEFFCKFLVVSTGYVQFPESRILLFQILKRIKHDRFFTKVFLPTTQKMMQFQQILTSNPKREMPDQRKLYQFVHILTDRYLHIYSVMSYEDVDPLLINYLKKYLENMDTMLQQLRTQQIQFEGQVLNIISRLSSIGLEQNENTFTFRIQIPQGASQEYRFTRQGIRRTYSGQDPKDWTYSNFDDDYLNKSIQYF